METVLPRMNTATENLQANLKEMDDKLKTSPNPLVQADVSNTVQVMSQSNNDKLSALDQHMQLLMTTVQQQDADAKAAAQIGSAYSQLD